MPTDLGPSGATPSHPSLSQRFRVNRAQAVIVFALGCGGVVGAVSRYAVSSAIPIVLGRFPWNTFLINVTGSALLGFLLVLLSEQFPRGRLVRPFFGTGIIGAYTTFSTMEVDALLIFRDHHLLIGVVYVVASIFGGLMTVWLGMRCARAIMRIEQWLQGEMT